MSIQFEDPLEQFEDLLERAKQTDLREPTAMTLATADRSGRTTIRTVLLKMFDARGFVFFTNVNSRKGRQLADNPCASLCFFWQTLFEQVLIDGTVQTVDAAEADEYWATRPRDSQFAAWASQQSEPLDSRATLEGRLADFHAQFVDVDVPRPPHWSGYRVVPERIEFWRSGWHRLHERVCYERAGDAWSVALLNP